MTWQTFLCTTISSSSPFCIKKDAKNIDHFFAPVLKLKKTNFFFASDSIGKKEFIDDDNSFPIMPVVMERQTTLEVS